MRTLWSVLRWAVVIYLFGVFAGATVLEILLYYLGAPRESYFWVVGLFLLGCVLGGGYFGYRRSKAAPLGLSGGKPQASQPSFRTVQGPRGVGRRVLLSLLWLSICATIAGLLLAFVVPMSAGGMNCGPYLNGWYRGYSECWGAVAVREITVRAFVGMGAIGLLASTCISFFQQRSAKHRAMDFPTEGDVLHHIMRTLTRVGDEGEPITPGLLARACEVAGAEAAATIHGSRLDLPTAALASHPDVLPLRQFYRDVALNAVALFGKSGPLTGSKVAAQQPPANIDPGSVGIRSVARARGLHYVPIFYGEPIAEMQTAGGFIDTDWANFRGTSARRLDGTWVLNYYDTEQVRVLHFFGDHFSGMAEIQIEDIASAHVAASGPNLAVEVKDGGGHTFVVVGPRGRIKRIFASIGWPV